MVRSSVRVYVSASQLLPPPSQNALIRELDHTKKLIEESHHEKVRDRLLRLSYICVSFSGGEFGLLTFFFYCRFLSNDGVFI